MVGNKKISAFFIIVLSILLMAWFFTLDNETNFQEQLAFNSVNAENLQVYYFYGEGCSHCAKASPFIEEMEAKYSIQTLNYDIYSDRDKLSLFDEYCNKYGIPSERRGVPTLFVSDQYFIGDSAIITNFENALLSAQTKNINSSSLLNKEETQETDDRPIISTEQVSLFTLTVSALVDAVSPCSIAILVFLIGARVLVSGYRKRALKVGLAFCLSIFIGYFLFGLGLFNVIQFSGFSGLFSVAVGAMAVVVGLLYLKDVFWYRRGGFAMEVPESLKPTLMRMLKKVTSPVGAFFMGFVVVCFELPCTGGPYLFILGQLANSATRLQSIPLLLYYNFIFVLPLIVITLLLFSNVLSLNRIRAWNDENLRLLRLGGGLAMIFLGLLVIPASLIFSFINVFLLGFRTVAPLVLFSFFICYILCFKNSLAKLLHKSKKYLTLAISVFMMLPLITSSIFVGVSPSVTSQFLPQLVSGYTSDQVLSSSSYETTLIESIYANLDSGKVVLTYFYLEGCPYCEKQAPIIDEMEQQFPEIAVIRVNGAYLTKETLDRFGVSGFPATLLIQNRNDLGELFYGFTEKEALQDRIIDNVNEEASPSLFLAQSSELSDEPLSDPPISGCTTISSPGLYSLTSDILDSTADTCITITSSDVVLDGQNYRIDGIGTKNSVGVLVHNPSGPLNNVVIKNLRVSNWYEGISLLNVTNSNVENNRASNNYIGIHLDEAYYSSVTGNTVSGYNNANSYAGIYISGYKHIGSYRYPGYAWGNTIQNNIVRSCWTFGIYIDGATTSWVLGNELTGQGQGLTLEHMANETVIAENEIIGNKIGLDLRYGSDENTIRQNEIVYNSLVGLKISSSFYNEVYDNIIKDSYDISNLTPGYGIQLLNPTGRYGGGNRIYNNFISNVQNVYLSGTGAVWNTAKTSDTNIVGGPYLGGNYWGHCWDPSESFSDVCEDADGDYICDSSYEISSSNIDYLPLKNFLDKDEDGVGDREDNCPDYSNPDQANADGDDYGDVCDNCRYVSNNDQADANNNCPAKPYLSDPKCGDSCDISDSDGDGVADEDDNCPTSPNPSQTNSDNDQWGDACDFCPYVSSQENKDYDNDGVGDDCDNCVYDANPGQENSDGDADGDICDGCPLDPNKRVAGVCGCGVPDTDTDGDHRADCIDECPLDSQKIFRGVCGCGVPDTDTDRDGIIDCIDNCPGLRNIDQKDSDGDGVGDVCDNCPLNSNSNQVDLDSDGYGAACDCNDNNKNLYQVCCGDTIYDSIVLEHDILNCPVNGLIIGDSDITIDGNGHKISGKSNGYGISVDGTKTASSITIKNLNISDFEYGIYLDNTSGIAGEQLKVLNNDIKDCDYGIFLSTFSSCEITHNKILQNNNNGLKIVNSDNCYLGNNEIRANSGVGIHLDAESDYNVLENNYVCRNTQDILNTDSSNTGSNNHCGVSSGWNDNGSEDCSMKCVGWYPYNYGFSFTNPSKDDLSYGHPLDSGNYREVFGTRQTWVSAWVCVGLIVWTPWTGVKCVGYEEYLPTIPDPHASLFFYGLLGAFGVDGWKDIAEGGECTGMSAKSLDFYYRYADNTWGSGYRYPSDFQAGAQRPADLIRQGRLAKSIENLQGTQLTWESIEYLALNAPDDPNEVLSSIKADLASGNRGILFVKSGLTSGHALVPDTYIDDGDITRVYVYDSNRPDTVIQNLADESQYPFVKIDRVANTFSYVGGSTVYQDAIYYVPAAHFYNVYKGSRTLPLSVYQMSVGIFSGQSNALFVDENGNRLGYDELGNEYEEIPGAKAIPFFMDTDKPPLITVLPVGNYKTEVFGTAQAGKYSNFYFHEGTSYSFENVTSSSGTRDHISVSFNANYSNFGILTLSTEDATKTFSARIVTKSDNEVYRTYNLVNGDLYQGDQVAIRTTSDLDGLIITNKGSHNITYGIEFSTNMLALGDDSNEMKTLFKGDFTVQPMTTNVVSPKSWLNLNEQEITIKRSEIGDGLCSEGEDYLNCPEDCSEILCVTPYDGMLIQSDTKLCKGNYTIPDSGDDGVITLAGDNVALDCNGAVLEGDGTGTGIQFAPGVSNATLHNCYVSNYDYGIVIPENAIENKVFNNYLMGNSEAGIKVTSGRNCSISENIVQNNVIGVLFENSQYNTLVDNVVCGNVELDLSIANSPENNGQRNACSKNGGWNDDGTGGCTYLCVYEDPKDYSIPLGSITINNGEPSTTNTGVILTLQAYSSSGVAQMRFSNDEITWSEWQDYSESITWTLLGGKGEKTVYVQFKDNDGLTATYSDKITLNTTADDDSDTGASGGNNENPDTTKPIANAGSDQTINEDAQITFDGTASTDNIGITSYTWTFTDTTAKTLTGVKTSYTFSNPGVYIITLTVKDAAGNEATDNLTVTVRDVTNPIADAGQDQTLPAGTTVSFDATSSTDNLGIVSYEWNFGDNTTGTGEKTTHTYPNEGTYTVTLTVKDAAGNSATDTIRVTIGVGIPLWTIIAAVVILVAISAGVIVFLKRK